MTAKFFKCETCGNIIIKIFDSGIKPFCCNSVMKEIFPESNDSSFDEKHEPVCVMDGNHVNVQVGELIHPTTKEHRIEWVFLETDKGGQIRYLGVTDEPIVTFTIDSSEKVQAVYAYCNVHGLWKHQCS